MSDMSWYFAVGHEMYRRKDHGLYHRIPQDAGCFLEVDLPGMTRTSPLRLTSNLPSLREFTQYID